MSPRLSPEMKRQNQTDHARVLELEAFPEGWTPAEFEIDQPGRDFDAGGLYMTVSCNATDRKGWHASIFFGDAFDAAWTKDGFPTAAAARAACVTKALAMLREAMDACRKADGR